MMQDLSPGLQIGTGIAATQDLSPGLQIGTGIALTQDLSPGLQIGTGIAATQDLSPGLQIGTGIAMTQDLSPGLQIGTGIAFTQVLSPGLQIGTGIDEVLMVDVANAADAPAIHIPRTRALTAFMTVVLLNQSCIVSSSTVVETSSYTKDYICYVGQPYSHIGII